MCMGCRAGLEAVKKSEKKRLDGDFLALKPSDMKKKDVFSSPDTLPQCDHVERVGETWSLPAASLNVRQA
jgi:hypothetical protein